MEPLHRHAISKGKTEEWLAISRRVLYDLMGRYRIPIIDMTPEELRRELTW